MSYAQIQNACLPHGLRVMGALHPRQKSGSSDKIGTLILLGTAQGFWPVFTASSEYQDDQPDPIDRWSKRIIREIASIFDARCSFPSDGPPYPPFIDWAMASGRFFQSPVGMMVHDQAGMMISLRGALQFADEFPLPDPITFAPCATCAAPCTTTCPVEALSAEQAYDVNACHTYLDTPNGQDCMTRGCQARRACPLSAGRDPAQSAFHMRAFHRATSS